MESILTSIKKLLGVHEEDASFDSDIIMHINSVFMTLNQLGVGPEECFSIESDEATWADFLDESKNYEAVRSYVYLRVRILFDPPASSTVMSSMERQMSELEWRLNLQSEKEVI